MDFKEYLKYSELTLSEQFNYDKKIELLLHGTMGILTEGDELLENYPDTSFFERFRVLLGLSNGGFDSINALEEFGDITWYLAIFFREYDIDYTSITPAHIISPRSSVEHIMSTACKNLDMLKKKIFYNKDFDEEEMKENVALIMSNMMGLCSYYKISIYDVYAKNIKKLKARYGDKFTSEGAINRNIELEREILESNDK